MLTSAASLLLVSRIQSEGESLSTFLVVRRLRNLCAKVEIRGIVLIDTG